MAAYPPAGAADAEPAGHIATPDDYSGGIVGESKLGRTKYDRIGGAVGAGGVGGGVLSVHEQPGITDSVDADGTPHGVDPNVPAFIGSAPTATRGRSGSYAGDGSVLTYGGMAAPAAVPGSAFPGSAVSMYSYGTGAREQETGGLGAFGGGGGYVEASQPALVSGGATHRTHPAARIGPTGPQDDIYPSGWGGSSIDWESHSGGGPGYISLTAPATSPTTPMAAQQPAAVIPEPGSESAYGVHGTRQRDRIRYEGQVTGSMRPLTQSDVKEGRQDHGNLNESEAVAAAAAAKATGAPAGTPLK